MKNCTFLLLFCMLLTGCVAKTAVGKKVQDASTESWTCDCTCPDGTVKHLPATEAETPEECQEACNEECPKQKGRIGALVLAGVSMGLTIFTMCLLLSFL